jgi:hypothetical protein
MMCHAYQPYQIRPPSQHCRDAWQPQDHDAKGQHTGVYVYWNDWNAIGANVTRMPEKGQAIDIAEAVAS